MYFIHGGGFVSGDERGAGLAAELERAEAVGAAVVSVRYRLAPEHRYPAALEDCFAGLVWLTGHARELGVDPAQIVVSGPSAGGGLAAGMRLLARERGGPSLLGQMLQQPMLDDRCDTSSAGQMDGLAAGTWDRTASITGWTALLGELRGTNAVSPLAARARAKDLSGLPPAYIDVGSIDGFRDEAITYADSIWRAGGQAELYVWPGGYHGFDVRVPDAELTRRANAARLAWLQRLLKPVVARGG